MSADPTTTRSPAAPRREVSPGRVGFVSLGCPKALVDSERIVSQLRADGYLMVDSYQEAELVVVNTCGFITPAVEESLDAIGEALAGSGKVVVTGCLGERPEKILARHPQVLAVTGQADVNGVMSAVRQALPPDENPFTSLLPTLASGARGVGASGARGVGASGARGLGTSGAQGLGASGVGAGMGAGDAGRVQRDGPAPVRLTPRHYAYLKIAEGCNHRCSFCIIPKLRGDLVSRPAADLVYEARRLVATGAKELLLIAQDLSAYGVDLRHAPSELDDRELRAHLVDLVEELAELGVWLRLHYVYPYPHVQALVELMAAGKLLPYLDVPLQHASPTILRAMRRPGGAVSHLATIERWRATCPELTLRSTFIVGFPGETEEHFEELLEFLSAARLDRVGAFTYSEVDEADANELPGAVPEEVKQERLGRLMSLQAEISREKLRAKVGRSLPVLIDALGDLPGEVVGRTQGDAPGIDGVVRAGGDGTLGAGDMVQVLVEGSDDHDLYGVVQRRS